MTSWTSSRCTPAFLVMAIFCGCASHKERRDLKIPDMRHVSASRADAVSVSFTGEESSLFRLPFGGPQGIEISGIPTGSGVPLVVSSEYDYSIFCNEQRVPAQAKQPCRKHNPFTYSEDCDYSPGISAKVAVIYPDESKIYCEVTPFFWRAYCNREEEGQKEARVHSHTYDGGGGCEWPDTQEFLVYLQPSG